jgi:hypothetical protein
MVGGDGHGQKLGCLQFRQRANPIAELVLVAVATYSRQRSLPIRCEPAGATKNAVEEAVLFVDPNLSAAKRGHGGSPLGSGGALRIDRRSTTSRSY